MALDCRARVARGGGGRVSDTVIVALISSGGSVAIGITALALNFRLFNSLERRIERVEDKLDTLTGKVIDLDNRVSAIEGKLGIAGGAR
jgi:hypothetical protein